MHESREKRSLSLLRSLAVGVQYRTRMSRRSFIMNSHQHVSQPFIHGTPTQFRAVSKTVKRIESGSPCRITSDPNSRDKGENYNYGYRYAACVILTKF